MDGNSSMWNSVGRDVHSMSTDWPEGDIVYLYIWREWPVTSDTDQVPSTLASLMVLYLAAYYTHTVQSTQQSVDVGVTLDRYICTQNNLSWAIYLQSNVDGCCQAHCVILFGGPPYPYAIDNPSLLQLSSYSTRFLSLSHSLYVCWCIVPYTYFCVVTLITSPSRSIEA